MVQEENEMRLRRRALAGYKQYRDIFSSAVGKKILYDLMRQFFVLSPTFKPKFLRTLSGDHTIQCDPYETAYREGQRNVVLYILTKMKTDITKMEKLIEGAEKDGNQ